MTTEIRALYTRLPAIDRLLRDPAFSPLLAQHGHSQVVAQLRQMLDEAREQIRQYQTLPDWSHDWPSACAQRLTAGWLNACSLTWRHTMLILPSAWQPASRRLAAARYPSTACPARR